MPAAMGMSAQSLEALQTLSAFRTVFSSVWLPATTVTALRSIIGCTAAIRMATASSCPGSQS
jgi:hypothetical protein